MRQCSPWLVKSPFLQFLVIPYTSALACAFSRFPTLSLALFQHSPALSLCSSPDFPLHVLAFLLFPVFIYFTLFP
ncbi:hypothetical protein EDB86DRAFT_3007098 [Lactarius hatsudake]|nr:hypothetical protein EDB86DRAFT_3007098 [Lactarius hatsudake]